VSSVADLIADAAARHPDKAALINRERTIAYRQLDDRVARAAGALRGLGVGGDDRVAILLGNVPEFVEALHGVLRVGGVAAPL
jgi:acyl-CoA synthetase (AMP-forming)/AMP-acid ligase II